MNTREKILDAAMEVFGHQGYAKASMDQIAACAGVSKGALYYFFRNKSDLYWSMIQDGVDYLHTILDAALEQPATPERYLYDIISAYVNLALDHPAYVDTLAGLITEGGDPAFTAKARAVFSKMVDKVAEILQEGVAMGAVRVHDLPFTAVSFLSMALGAYLAQRRLGLLRQDREAMIRGMYHMAGWGLLGAAPEGAPSCAS